MTTELQTVETSEPKQKRTRTGKRAWVFQYPGHVAKYGAGGASWYVGWNDPRGKRRAESCGPGKQGRSIATRRADKLHGELVEGTYENHDKTTWEEFLVQYTSRVLDRKPKSAETARISLATFAKVMKPGRVRTIDSGTIEEFAKKRLTQPGRGGKVASLATVNRELRYLRHALRRAKRWGIIDDVPEFDFEREPERIPTFVPPDHFAAIYAACSHAKRPRRIPNVDAPDFWRALIVFAYMTGWRIGQILALKWADVDLGAGTAISRAEDNKGKRECQIPLHPMIVEHLLSIKAGSWSSPRVFAWDTNRRALWDTFADIQDRAKLADDKPIPRGGKGGRRYGFHDLRRGFATMNAAGMDLFQLQSLMQHKSLSTTKLYVNMSNRLTEVVGGLFVPTLTKKPVTAAAT